MGDSNRVFVFLIRLKSPLYGSPIVGITKVSCDVHNKRHLFGVPSRLANLNPDGLRSFGSLDSWEVRTVTLAASIRLDGLHIHIHFQGEGKQAVSLHLNTTYLFNKKQHMYKVGIV